MTHEGSLAHNDNSKRSFMKNLIEEIQYPQRKNWTFSKLRIGSVVVRFFRNLRTTNCPKCQKGKVKYIGDDWTGHTWISVYECIKCKCEFI